MNVFIILILIATILELLICKFSLWWIIAVIARLLFCLRVVGATFNVKKLCVTEGVAVGCMLIFNMLFHKGAIPWLRVFAFLLFAVFNCVMMFLDDILYVYVIEDDEDN